MPRIAASVGPLCIIGSVGFLLVGSVAAAQQPPRSRADSIARADSIQRADSLAIVRELEAGAASSGTPRPAQGPTTARLLDLSAVGDLIADLSPDGTTSEDGSRFGVREVEIALQAAVDPSFRGDLFIGFSDAEGVAIEQAFLTTTSLPWSLEARLGRFLMPFGKDNTTHRHDLHTIDHAYVIQDFLGPEGFKGTGIQLSKVLAPFGFYQELITTLVDGYGEGHGHDDEPALEAEEPTNQDLSGLVYSARLRNYWDLSQASNIELSASAMTGLRVHEGLDDVGGAVGVNARQSVIGADFTFRWRPLQQGLYRSFLLRAEAMRQLNERAPALPTGITYAGPTRGFNGGYLFARYQLTRRTFLGVRGDLLEDPEDDGEILRAGSGYLVFYPSEFSKLVAGFERLSANGGVEKTNRLVLQATFALGPHKPHPF
jgi:hypothetical protein